jgi:hypothetical protein
MHTLSPLILLHENGYKVLTAANGGDDVRLVVEELQNRIVRVGEGEFDATVGFGKRHG